MVYLAFDLDGTIGNFMPVWKLLCPFDMIGHFRTMPSKQSTIPQMMTEDLKWELDIAYSAFVKRVADAETSDKPLGIFRPGIFKVFSIVSKLKSLGVVEGVIMYTNNSSPSLFNFAKDVITYVNKGPMFDDVLDYLHHLRIKAPGSNKPPVHKTWVELKKLLIESKSRARPDIGPSDVMFFDDMLHQDMATKLGPNFVKLAEYTGRPTNERLKEVFLAALNDSNLLAANMSGRLFTYSALCTQDRLAANVNEYLTLLTTGPKGVIGGPNKGLIATDTAYGNSESMITALNSLTPIVKKRENTNNNNLRVLKRLRPTKKTGGRRRRTRKSIYKYY